MRPLIHGAALCALLFASRPQTPAAPGSRCLLHLLHADRDLNRTPMFNNGINVNYDVAGHVHMQCYKQEIYLDADSVSALSGDITIHMCSRARSVSRLGLHVRFRYRAVYVAR